MAGLLKAAKAMVGLDPPPVKLEKGPKKPVDIPAQVVASSQTYTEVPSNPATTLVANLQGDTTMAKIEDLLKIQNEEGSVALKTRTKRSFSLMGVDKTAWLPVSIVNKTLGELETYNIDINTTAGSAVFEMKFLSIKDKDGKSKYKPFFTRLEHFGFTIPQTLTHMRSLLKVGPKSNATKNTDSFYGLLSDAIAKKYSVKPLNSKSERSMEDLFALSSSYFSEANLEETRDKVVKCLQERMDDLGLNSQGYLRFKKKMTGAKLKALQEKGRSMAKGKDK